jgi:hypothetical protein
LKSQHSQFHRALATKLLGYALGRAELASDQPLINDLVSELERSGKITDCIVRIVTSQQFNSRRPGANP